jgi:hypothetical protein
VILKKPELRPFPGQEPKPIKSDLSVFDRCNVTRRVKLLDEELPPTIEERPERQPYTLKRRKRLPRPFLSPAGEVVLRLRGGRGFTPIYPPWSPAGLARVRGTVVKVANGWAPYPRLWAARKPGLGPYVLRGLVDPVFEGRDVSGCPHPLAADYVEHVLRSNRDAQADLNKIVPQEIEPEWAKAVHDLELEAATLMAMQEPGPEAEINLQDYGAKRRVRMKSGKVSWLDGQQSADRQKPGPKPQLGIALSARLRKVKQRCKARGVPFVLADHIKPKELIHDHGTRSGADGH